MTTDIEQAVTAALETVLLPVVVRWLLKAGVSGPNFVELVRNAYVDEAQKSLFDGTDSEKSTVSKISVRTGFSRRVVRNVRTGAKRKRTPVGKGNRAQRVLTGWWQDPDFRDELGRPRILQTYKGKRSFAELCRRYSGERQTKTLLEDLIQAGAVRLLPANQVQVLRQNYAAVGWTEAGQVAIAEQLAEHLQTLLHNLSHPEGSQYWACKRVANPHMLAKPAAILLRDLRTQIETQASTYFDRLTAPQVSAEPGDLTAKHISITTYITETPAAVPAYAEEHQSVPPNMRDHLRSAADRPSVDEAGHSIAARPKRRTTKS